MFPVNPGENWLQKNIDQSNANARIKAEDDLRVYNQNLAQWEKDTIHARQTGAAISPAPMKPTITIWYDGGGFLASRVEVNPAAKDAVLPALPTTLPNNPGFGGTTAGDRDRAMFQLLYGIEALLKALAAKQGI